MTARRVAESHGRAGGIQKYEGVVALDFFRKEFAVIFKLLSISIEDYSTVW